MNSQDQYQDLLSEIKQDTLKAKSRWQSENKRQAQIKAIEGDFFYDSDKPNLELKVIKLEGIIGALADELETMKGAQYKNLRTINDNLLEANKKTGWKIDNQLKKISQQVEEKEFYFEEGNKNEY